MELPRQYSVPELDAPRRDAAIPRGRRSMLGCAAPAGRGHCSNSSQWWSLQTGGAAGKIVAVVQRQTAVIDQDTLGIGARAWRAQSGRPMPTDRLAGQPDPSEVRTA